MSARAVVACAWLAALAFLYAVPHTIALRNLLLVAGAAVLVAAQWRDRRPLAAGLAWAKPAGWMVAALTGWIVLQSVFISPFPARALDLMPGGWLVPLATGAIGLLAAVRMSGRQAVTAATLALAAHIAILIGYQAGAVLKTGSLPAVLTPYAERDFHSLVNVFLIAMLLADRLSRRLNGTAALALPSPVAWGLLAMAMVADPLLRTRNGTLVSALLVIATLGLLLTRTRLRHAMVLFAAVAATLAVLVTATLVADARWKGFGAAVGVALHSDSLYWLDPTLPLPATPAGQPVDESAYMRTAWARQALEAIARHPLGLGFGHQAFGWAVELKYGVKGMESSHSGWLDFALANGLPGLALWLALSVWLILAGWRRFVREGDGAALLLAAVVFCYLARCLVDGHLSGWRLALFALLVGAALGTTAKRPGQP